MKETLPQRAAEDTAQELAGPKGVGMAVAFDWGLSVQILALPFINIFTGLSTPAVKIDLSSTLSKVLVFAGSALSALLLAVFGEAVRRGRNWARWIQIVANALLTLGGILSIVNYYRSIKSGNFWPVVTAVILLFFSPLIAWRLSRPQSARWFKSVTSAAARKRHGGMWIFYIALWAIAGGILQAIASVK